MALLAVLFCVPSALWANTQFNGVVTTLNTGTTTLSAPDGIAVSLAGDVYIADGALNTVFKVSASGTTSALDLSAVGALHSPTALALDPAGTLYIADTGNNRILQVNAAGNASVVNLGSLTLYHPQGLALSATGTLYIADTSNDRIIALPPGGTAAVFTLTGLSTPLGAVIGLCTDVLGNLYIGDEGHNRVIKATAAGAASVVTVGNSLPTPLSPYGLAVDTLGNLFIADLNGSGLVGIVSSTGVTTLRSFGSTAVYPYALAVDPAGTLYVADTLHHQVVTQAASTINFGHVAYGAASGTTITLPFSISDDQTLSTVQALTVGAPNLDFTVVASGTTCTAGASSTGCNVNVQFLPTAPGLRRGAVVLTFNNLTVTVPVFGMSDAPMATLSPGAASVMNVGATALSYPFQAAFDGAGNIYVANYGSTANVVKFPAGGGTGTVVSTGAVTLSQPIGVAVDGVGNLFIADHYGPIVEVPVVGSPSTLSITGLGGTGLSIPTAINVDVAGNLYISDYGNGRIVKVTPTGAGSVVNAGSYTFSSASVSGVAVDQYGTIYFNDVYGNRVVKVTAAGAASLVVPAGITPALSGPRGVAVDGMGNLYIVDGGTSRIIEVTTAGVASVLPVAGLTSPANLNYVYSLATDPSGNLIIPDFENSRIVNVNLAAGKLAYATTAVGSTSTDSPKVANLTNIGNLSLVFAADPVYPADFVVNTGDTSLCAAATPLTAGMACDIAAKFIPLSPGALSETVALTDNALNVAGSAQQVTVTGTGLRVDTTAVAVTATPATITIGQPITITAAVTDATAPGTVPTGYVTFSDVVGSTATSLTSGLGLALSGTGIATLSNVVLSGGGTHTITANYTGVSGSFLTSTNTTTVLVNLATATLTGPAMQPVQVVYGQAASIPVSITGATGLPGPAGTATYTLVNAANVTVASGTLTLAGGDGPTSLTIPVASTLASGLYTANVSYSGSPYYAAPSPLAIPLQVSQSTPIITFASPAPITYGTALGSGILTATAAFNGSSVPGSFSFTATPSGSIVTAATVLPAGQYTLTAIFTPTDTTTYTAAMAQAALTVTKAASMASVTASAATLTYGQSVTLTSVVTSTTTGTPTGSVSFYDGTLLLGMATVTNGQAVFMAMGLPTGVHSLTAVYSGDANFTGATGGGGGLAVTVTKAASVASVTASAATLTPGQSVTLTSVVTSTTAGTLTGSIGFYDGTLLLGTVPVTGGQAVFIATGLLSGVHSLTAVYSGDANFTGATGGGLAVTVLPLDFTFTSTQSGTPSILPGSAVGYSLNIASTYGSFPGAVTFTVSGLPAGATYTMNPASLPATSTGGPVTLTVQTAAQSPTAALRKHSEQFLWALLVLPLAGARRLRRMRRRLRGAGLLMLLLLGSAAVLGLSGCGDSIGIFGPSPQSYSLTVTATSGAVQHAVNLSMSIQ